MSALTNHNQHCLLQRLRRLRSGVMWISAVHEGQRVDFFPTNIMDEKERSEERQLYIVEFSPVCVWATEEERLDHLVYKLLDSQCSEVSESFTMEDLGFDEETLPYGVLNNKDGSIKGGLPFGVVNTKDYSVT